MQDYSSDEWRDLKDPAGPDTRTWCLRAQQVSAKKDKPPPPTGTEPIRASEMRDKSKGEHMNQAAMEASCKQMITVIVLGMFLSSKNYLLYGFLFFFLIAE